MGILVKTVRIHFSCILLQTRKIGYDKCDSTNFEEKERKETIKLGIALAV